MCVLKLYVGVQEVLEFERMLLKTGTMAQAFGIEVGINLVHNDIYVITLGCDAK